MSDKPVHIVLAAFDDEAAAGAAVKTLTNSDAGRRLSGQAAVLRRDDDNTLHISETHDMSGGKGAVIGGVLGAVLGLLVGPVGWAALGGAALGGLAAKLSDSGFDDERLQRLGATLAPGTSALVAVVDDSQVQEVEQHLTQAGAKVVTEGMDADIAAQLAASRDATTS